MAIFKDRVIIIKSTDFGERDRIFSLFGKRSGRFSAIGKGVRRLESRKGGHLQTFNVCKISYAKGKSLDIITEVESESELDTTSIPKDVFERVGFISLVLDKFLPEGVSEPDIFSDIEGYIEGDMSEEKTKKVVLDVLKRLGFAGEKQENLSYQKLQLFVDKILDRA